MVIGDFETPRDIFVFTSTLAAKHDKGDALIAVRDHGAVVGEPMGLIGDSYAIATRNEKGKKISFDEMRSNAWFFVSCAMRYPHLTFNMTEIGAEEFGREKMRLLFKRIPRNINLPKEWNDIWKKEEEMWLESIGLKED